MSIPRDLDLRLKCGNLFLAAFVSLVPTAMTIGFLGVHGYILCRTLDRRLDVAQKIQTRELCDESNLSANFDYVVWIWLFILMPTWRWFYIGHLKRVTRERL